jgi:predicted transcriptional regulator
MTNSRLAAGSKERAKVVKVVQRQYKQGASIRQIADETGRSYGNVHRLLSESGVTLRPRGQAPAKKSKR